MQDIHTSVLLKQLLSRNEIAQADYDLISEQLTQYQTVPLALVEKGVITTKQLTSFCCSVFNLPIFDFSNWAINNAELLLQHEIFIREFQVLPVHIGHTSVGDSQNMNSQSANTAVVLVTADPTNIAVQNDFEFNTGLHTELVVADPVQLKQEIEQLFPLLQSQKSSPIKEKLKTLTPVSWDEIRARGADYKPDYRSGDLKTKQTHLSSKAKIDDAIIEFVDKTLQQAVLQGASDLHFEPYENDFRIRFRIDGILTEIDKPPSNLFNRLAARLKVMANMDIAEKRKPQDGRLHVTLYETKQVEFRVSTLPTIFGEKVVLRILDTKNGLVDVNKLGFEPYQQQEYINALQQPQGLILVTGPTGSGKSLTLYSGLTFLNTENRNISTIEDPVEYHIKGINQVQVNEKAQLDFARSLRAFLRQDPDVVMVGEIRDLETAQIAIKASQTGHLVLSTLHTNSAAETLNRLMNMGIPAYNLASAISLIIAQRLVRVLCRHCKTPEHDIPDQELINQGFKLSQCQKITLFRAVGCRRCNQGYKGRTSIFEVLNPTQEIRDLVLSGAAATEINAVTQVLGVKSLRQAGLLKVKQGLTSLQEINRVVSADGQVK